MDQLDAEAYKVLEKLNEVARRQFKEKDYQRAWKPLNNRNWQTLIDTLDVVAQRILDDAHGRGNAETDEEYFGNLAKEPYLSRDHTRYFSEEFEARFAR